MLFTMLWAIVKGFMDERGRAKVKIFGSIPRDFLREAIEPANLPRFLGGDCTCSHVEGGCLHSDAGSWNDYVCIDRELKHKSELLVEEEKKEEICGPDLGGGPRSEHLSAAAAA